MIMELKKNCKHCGKTFFKGLNCGIPEWNNRRKYCSVQCRINHTKHKEERICQNCDKKFLCDSSRKSIYCSHNCWNKYTRKHNVTIKGETCKKDFIIRHYQIARSINHYCSVKCKGLAKRSQVIKICKYCNKSFQTYKYDVNRKFCSNKCKDDSTIGIRKGEWIKTDCKNCGNPIERLKSHTYKDNIFCNRHCFSEWETGKNNNNWNGGKSFEPYGSGFSRKLKRQIRERDNHTCQECKFTEEQLGYKLPVHHIDYNKKNNHPDNLISLCKGCHGQTGFKREDWTNYFKKSMRGVVS